MDNYTTLFAVLDATRDEIMNKMNIGPCAKLKSIHTIYTTALNSTNNINMIIKLLTSLYKIHNILFPQLFRSYDDVYKLAHMVFTLALRIQYTEIPTMSHVNKKLVDDMVREFDIFRKLIDDHYRASGHSLHTIDSKANKLDSHETKRNDVLPTTPRPRRNLPRVNYKGTC